MVVLLDQEKHSITPTHDEIQCSPKLKDDSLQPERHEERRRPFRRFSLWHCVIVCSFVLLYKVFDFGGHFGKNIDHPRPLPVWNMDSDHDHHKHHTGKRPVSRKERFEKLFLCVVDHISSA